MKRVFIILATLLMLSAFIFATGQVEKEEAACSLPEGVEAGGMVTFWYAMPGSCGRVVDSLLEKFSREFPNIKVEAVY